MIQTDVNELTQNHNINYQELMEAIKCFSPCMNDFLYVYDIDSDLYSISQSAVKRFLIPAANFNNVVESHRQFVYEEDFDMLQEDLGMMINGIKDSHDLTYRWVGVDGNPIWINCRGLIIRGKHSLMVGCINEIGEKSYADNVTGLLRIGALKNKLSKLPVTSGFLLRIGIDGFKHLNERLGNDFGDIYLRELANCIKDCLTPDQNAYRMISDEILITDFSGASEKDATILYKRIRSKMDEVLRSKNYEAVFTISGGIITEKCIDIPYEDLTYDWINNRSQFSLTRAKELGRNQVYAFNPDDYNNFLRRGKILQSIRKSISENFKGFYLNFQPIMYGRREKVTFAAESLIRYIDEYGELISPYELIPILEESGLIIPVGNWVMNETFRVCKKCQELDPNFKVSINLSYVQFRKINICENITDAIVRYGLSADSIILEMTESGYLEYAAVKKAWDRLGNDGFIIAIDDFGTGYSNLHNIVELHPDIVKIDRSFTIKALHNDYEALLMKYIVSMVHSIDVNIVIEGIETKDELDKINQFGPDFIQGYFYSKPISETELFAWLDNK